MATALKLLLALLNAVPAIIKAIQEHQRTRDVKKTEQAIDDDTFGEWSERFGQLRDDTYSDPATRCMCEPPVVGNTDGSPCTRGGDLSPKDGNGKTTEVH